MQSRPDFDEACKLLVAKYASAIPSLENSPMRGWTWNEHSVVPGLGYLSRSATLAAKSSSDCAEESEELGNEASISEETEDEAYVAPRPSNDILSCRQYITFSSTFQVPCFYFTICRSEGTPLSANELVKTSLFHRFVLDDTQTTSFAVSHPSALFPLLSQGDHPTLGTPCWYLHPCETAKAMEELLNEDQDEKTREERLATEAVIVAASRSPTGSINGTLKSFTAPQLGSAVLKHTLASQNIDPSIVEEVYFGNVVQAGVGQSPARQAALGAGLSTSSDATTINKVCASGMKSVMLAAQAIQLGQRSVVAAGGMESMSNAPFLIPRTNPAFGKFTAIDSLETDGLWDTYNNQAMGCCGEAAAEKYGITRESQDAHAVESYKRAEKAWKEGAFDAEIVPITVKGKKGDTIVKEDDEYKRIIYEKVPSLRSAFKQGGSITAANSSPLSDGASAVILMSAEKAKELGLKPLAKIVSYADAGVDPIDFPAAPTVALPKALEKANLTVNDISLFEINEAFSVVVRIAEKNLGIDPAKINVNGGAVALGHAIGSSGSRIIVSLVHALKSGEYGAAGVCNGGGAASAIVIQKL
ncbi:hypothetical protein VNI00_005626 [Paramarasmius palmivorus]|uniref:acetyl-CoA C-acetyltransferase n=1 Tax=Paramarasmius palmivorus TaxID=297713 RepID=A0AAW0DD35_9AGAR